MKIIEKTFNKCYIIIFGGVIGPGNPIAQGHGGAGTLCHIGIILKDTVAWAYCTGSVDGGPAASHHHAVIKGDAGNLATYADLSTNTHWVPDRRGAAALKGKADLEGMIRHAMPESGAATCDNKGMQARTAHPNGINDRCASANDHAIRGWI